MSPPEKTTSPTAGEPSGSLHDPSPLSQPNSNAVRRHACVTSNWAAVGAVLSQEIWPNLKCEASAGEDDRSDARQAKASSTMTRRARGDLDMYVSERRCWDPPDTTRPQPETQ